MTAAKVMRSATTAGITLALSAAGTLKASGDQAAVDRLLPSIRENKAAIVALLSEPANDPERKAWRWLVYFSDRNPLSVAFSPPAAHGEVLADYPDALAAEPIEDDPDGAVLRYDTLPADGMHRCTECSNLRGGLCSVAKPGGLVSAIVGYRPVPGLLVRCAGYSAATAGKNDQTGDQHAD